MNPKTRKRPGTDSSLDMGIWGDMGTVWLPKHFYPTRNDAKRFAVAELGLAWIESRVRTRWLRVQGLHEDDGSEAYGICEKADQDAFECWEIA